MAAKANLRMIANEENEDRFGYVYAVSGPGTYFTNHFIHIYNLSNNYKQKTKHQNITLMG